MSSHIHLNQNDTEPLDVRLGRGGRPFALDGDETILFIMRLRGEEATFLESACTILDAAQGKIRTPFADGDLSTVGVFDAQWQVTFSDGTVGSWPKDGYKTIYVQADLGPFVS